MTYVSSVEDSVPNKGVGSFFVSRLEISRQPVSSREDYRVCCDNTNLNKVGWLACGPILSSIRQGCLPRNCPVYRFQSIILWQSGIGECLCSVHRSD